MSIRLSTEAKSRPYQPTTTHDRYERAETIEVSVVSVAVCFIILDPICSHSLERKSDYNMIECNAIAD